MYSPGAVTAQKNMMSMPIIKKKLKVRQYVHHLTFLRQGDWIFVIF